MSNKSHRDDDPPTFQHGDEEEGQEKEDDDEDEEEEEEGKRKTTKKKKKKHSCSFLVLFTVTSLHSFATPNQPRATTSVQFKGKILISLLKGFVLSFFPSFLFSLTRSSSLQVLPRDSRLKTFRSLIRSRYTTKSLKGNHSSLTAGGDSHQQQRKQVPTAV